MNQTQATEKLRPDAPIVSSSGSLIVIDGRVQLRTLTRIRWMAVIGQLMALFWVQFGLDWSLPINSALLVVGVSVLLNLVMTFRHPEQGLLKEWEAASYLAFDTLQLAFLLYLTGGLTNPFALLFLGPVTVSATVLTRRATVILCGLVVICATALVFRHLPLPWTDIGLELPKLYVWGLWIAVVIGTLFLAVYAGSLAAESRRMSNALSVTQLSLAREQQLSAVGGLAAAAAHELGSPLSTILVIATELKREMHPNSEFNDDIKILCAEAVRCKEILAELLVQPSTEDSRAPFARIHLSDLVRSTADRYPKQGVSLDVNVSIEDNSKEPIVFSSPEFIHGLGNIVQNALQFALEKVSVEISWSIDSIFVIVRDDGPGFSPALLDRVGEPYISTRGDDHLGLGLFIAQSLLQRTGGRLTVSNIRGEGGYVEGSEVLIKWLRSSLDIIPMKR